MARTLKFLCAGVLVGALVFAGTSSSLAGNGPTVPDRVKAAKLCLQGGYQDLYTQQGKPFKTPGWCVIYALAGGELVQLKLVTSYPGDYPDWWRMTVMGFGLAHWDGFNPVFSNWILHLLPEPNNASTSYSGGSRDGKAGQTFSIPCSEGYTAAYAVGTTHAGYPVTSRPVAAGVGCPGN